MAQLLVRNLESQLKVRLQRVAKKHGRSMEEEAREILRNALREEDAPSGGLGTAIAALFRDHGLQEDIPELRGHAAQPAIFKP
jgi:plasmid stability protein